MLLCRDLVLCFIPRSFSKQWNCEAGVPAVSGHWGSMSAFRTGYRFLCHDLIASVSLVFVTGVVG